MVITLSEYACNVVEEYSLTSPPRAIDGAHDDPRRLAVHISCLELPIDDLPHTRKAIEQFLTVQGRAGAETLQLLDVVLVPG